MAPDEAGDKAEYDDAPAGMQTPEGDGKREGPPNRTKSWVEPSHDRVILESAVQLDGGWSIASPRGAS